MKELVQKHYNVKEEKVAQQNALGSRRIRRFRFLPKPGSEKWTSQRAFYLFGGNGEPIRLFRKGFDSKKAQRYEDDAKERLSRLERETFEDANAVIARTEESLRLLEGFLEIMGQQSLRYYISSSLYGEGKAYEMRAKMESVGDMEHNVLKKMRSAEDNHNDTIKTPNKPKSIWVCPQLTPYRPYVGVIFIPVSFIRSHPKFIDPIVGKKHFFHGTRSFYLAERDLEENLLRDRISKKINNRKTNPKSALPTECELLDLWNWTHNLALSRMFGVSFPHEKGSRYGEVDSCDWIVLDFQMQTDRAVRSIDHVGFEIPLIIDLTKIVDFALISSREMYERGEFRFLVFEPEKLDN